MVVLIQSQTVPINPPGVQPVLTVAQFWNVLKTKSRKPQLFIKQIASATILKESDFGLTREASLKDGMIGPPSGKFVEDVYFKKPWKVDFKAQGQNGTFVSNIISQGEDVTDLYLTFYFERIYPNMEDDSEEANKASEQLCALAREAVSETVVVARKMVTEGEIKILC